MMQLYSGTTCPFSHRCRFVLYEKGMDFQVIDVDLYNKPEDIAVMNPYNRLPVLVERDLILYESNIINEYIDERFPHPQLMPADPVMRARARLFLFRFERDINEAVDEVQARSLVRELALVMQAALLRQHANDAIFDAFCRSRLQGTSDVFGLRATRRREAIIVGVQRRMTEELKPSHVSERTRRRGVGNHPVLAEPAEGERGDQLGHLPARDRVRHRRPEDRRTLEPPRPHARHQEEVPHLRLPEQR